MTRRRRGLLVAALVAALGLAAAPAAATEPAPPPTAEEATPRIVGGVPASGSWPFMVALLATGVPNARAAQFCGGTLIRPTWVLTAAHCVSGQRPGTFDVAVGALDLAQPVPRIAVAEVVVNPGYEPGTLRSDLALVRLAQPAGAEVVATATPDTAASWQPGTQALLLGWGATTTIGTGRPLTLLQAELPILSDATCEAFYASYGAGYTPGLMLCAGAVPTGPEPVADACLGDSGGPLLVPHAGGWLQVGIVSYGPPPPARPCGAGPTAYTEVAAFADWITAVAGGAGPEDTIPVPRTAGPDRYATAAAFAQRWPSGVPAVVVASGVGFADALVAAPAASLSGGPILLTDPAALPGVVANELDRLAPQRIVVIGGPAAVSAGVEADLAAWAPVERVAGADRYATAAEVSRRFFPAGLSPAYPVVMVASGEGFADALTASSVSAAVPQNPVLLTRQGALPADTSAELARLRPTGITVVGGRAAVSDVVAGALGAYGAVNRIAGADRYATAATVATDLWEDAPLVLVASGEQYADALVAGAAGRPLLLVPRDGLPTPVTDALFALRPTEIEVIGGTASVSQATALALSAFVVPAA